MEVSIWFAVGGTGAALLTFGDIRVAKPMHKCSIEAWPLSLTNLPSNGA